MVSQLAAAAPGARRQKSNMPPHGAHHQPPKRGKRKSTAASASASTPKQTPSRRNPPRSSAARTRAKPIPSDAEIHAAFTSYAVARDDISHASELSSDDGDGDGDGEPLLRTADVRRCLSALGLPPQPADFFDADQRVVSGGDFAALARTLAEAAADDSGDGASDGEGSEFGGAQGEHGALAREIDEAFALFLGGRAAARITLEDLRRVAKSLKEEVDDKTLALMIEQANGEEGRASIGRGVGREEFEDVMRRAKVFV